MSGRCRLVDTGSSARRRPTGSEWQVYVLCGTGLQVVWYRFTGRVVQVVRL